MKRNRVVAVFGRKGSGKSYWLKQQVDQRRGLVVVWDSVSDFAGPTAERPIRAATVFRDVRDLLTAGAERRLPRVCVVQAPRPQFPVFCAWTARVGRLLVVVDEVNLYCKPGWAPPELLELLRIGRHAQVDLFVAARRPAEISRDITAQADEVRSFRTCEPVDLEWFRRYCGTRFAEGLPRLGKWRSAVFVG